MAPRGRLKAVTHDPHPYHFPTLTTSSTPSLERPARALADARAARAAQRGVPAADPARREALQSALGSLRDAWGPEHRAYVRVGRQIGRVTSNDPVRVLRRDMLAERRRLLKALNPTSGSRAEPLPPLDLKAMNGHFGRFEQVMREVAAEHALARDRYGGGGWTGFKGGGAAWTMRELNAEAVALRAKLRKARWTVKVAWDRFEPAEDPYGDVRERVAERLGELREEADFLAAEVDASAKVRKPIRSPRRRRRAAPWTPGEIRYAVERWSEDHGRLPTAREFNDPTNGLPFYTTVRRMIGPSPLARLAAESSTLRTNRHKEVS
jgi:hypothetical protein